MVKKEAVKKKRRGTSLKKVTFLIVLLFVIGTTIAPASAGRGYKPSIKIIDEKLELIDDDPTINSFLYNRMGEQEIEAVKIVVITGHWYRWSRQEVKTFYVVRNDSVSGIDIINSYEDDGLWTFYPKIGQTINALNVLLSGQVTVRKIIRMGILAILVYNENVPDIMEIIDKSPWASSYLPDWAKDFLERFEERH
ncbi:hypothetical protein ES705_16972 [subsurface metagenome]|nr:hypothetical protein [Methanosarcinales archaeon]